MNDRDRIRELEQQVLRIARSMMELVRTSNAQASAIQALQQALLNAANPVVSRETVSEPN